MIDEDEVRRHYTTLRPSLDERGRRLFAASQVRALGYGGIAAVARATGIAPSTIGRGLKELDQVGGIAAPAAERVRRPGGGRKRLSDTDATLVHNLLRLVEPATLGDPMRALLWVSKSTEKLSAALRALGHRVSANTVLRLLRTLGFSRQGNFKANEGRHHPDRDAQFEHINATVLAFQAAEQPVISVDTKKKELIGNYKNAGTELRPQGQPRRVNGHDFADKELGKAIPYGVYDVTDNSGWVSIGVTHDTAQFAVNAIRLWLEKMGRARYPNAERLMITADGGGSNGARLRLWKLELQKLADETGLTFAVCHYPPGTSKWNKIEHRLFCHITRNWQARPLTSRLAVVELIAATTTKTGLTITCALDTANHPKNIKVNDAEMDAIAIVGDPFHPEWNYSISPRNQDRALVVA
jgi:DNA-binding transcriptional ArsR family regulator